MTCSSQPSWCMSLKVMDGTAPSACRCKWQLVHTGRADWLNPLPPGGSNEVDLTAFKKRKDKNKKGKGKK